MFPRPVEWLSTAHTPDHVIQQIRKQGVGGSDVAAILGDSPFTTSWELWASKTGRLDEYADSERMLWGRVLETEVAREWAARNDARIRRLGVIADPVHPWRRASLDRVVLGSGTIAAAVLEVKCTSERSGALDDDELIERYNHQLQWYLGITGLPVAYLAVLIGTTELRCFTVPADEAEYRRLCKAVDAWWDKHVVYDEPPFMDWRDNKAANRLPAINGETVQVTSGTRALLAHLAELKRGRSEVDKAIGTCESALKGHLNEATELVDADGNVLATWRPQIGRRLDVARLKAEQPELWTRYAVTTGTRVLRIKNGATDE